MNNYVQLFASSVKQRLHTFTSGQQPYLPLGSWQHVLPCGHSDWSSHLTVSVTLMAILLFLLIMSQLMLRLLVTLSHFPWAVLHLVPLGQQCCPSAQHTACMYTRNLQWTKHNVRTPYYNVYDHLLYICISEKWCLVHTSTSGQQPQFPAFSLQQVDPSGHSDCLSGQITDPTEVWTDSTFLTHLESLQS